MKKFKIKVKTWVVFETIVEVEAETTRMAREQALDIARQQERQGITSKNRTTILDQS